jgi:hypothetical protein
MHVFAIFLLDLIHVGRFHEGKLVRLGGHLLGEEVVFNFTLQRNQPKHPIASEDILDVLDLPSIVQVYLCG